MAAKGVQGTERATRSAGGRGGSNFASEEYYEVSWNPLPHLRRLDGPRAAVEVLTLICFVNSFGTSNLNTSNQNQ